MDRVMPAIYGAVAWSLLMSISAGEIFADPNICGTVDNYHHVKFIDRGPGKREKGYVCYIVRDDPELTGVITLRNLSRSGDWDVLIGKSFDSVNKKVYETIDYNNNNGTSDELVWLPSSGYDEYVIVAYPTSEVPSEACIVFHRIDTNRLLGEALVMAGIQSIVMAMISDENDTQKDDNNQSRIVAAGLSALKRNNPAAIGYDMALNEISVQLSNSFGGGSFLFTWGINYFGGFLEESGKFSFGSGKSCG